MHCSVFDIFRVFFYYAHSSPKFYDNTLLNVCVMMFWNDEVFQILYILGAKDRLGDAERRKVIEFVKARQLEDGSFSGDESSKKFFKTHKKIKYKRNLIPNVTRN